MGQTHVRKIIVSTSSSNLSWMTQKQNSCIETQVTFKPSVQDIGVNFTEQKQS